MKTEECIHNVTVFGSKSSIVAIDTRSDNTLIALGSVEGEVKIFNVISGKIVGHFQNAKQSSNNDDAEQEESYSEAIETVLFSAPEGNQLITGSLNGLLSVWDLSSQVSKLSTKVGSGLVKLAWTKDSMILAATLDGLIRILDPRSGKIIQDCSGHTLQILDFGLTR